MGRRDGEAMSKPQTGEEKRRNRNAVR